MKRLMALVVLALATVITLGGCQPSTLPLPCEMAIAALPADSTLEPGDPLPAGSQVLAGPDDFDRAAVAVAVDGSGGATVDLALRGDAIARFGAHTAGHLGESIAIAINGTVVSVPTIQSPMLDGKVQITGAQGDKDLAQRFGGCVR